MKALLAFHAGRRLTLPHPRPRAGRLGREVQQGGRQDDRHGPRGARVVFARRRPGATLCPSALCASPSDRPSLFLPLARAPSVNAPPCPHRALLLYPVRRTVAKSTVACCRRLLTRSSSPPRVSAHRARMAASAARTTRRSRSSPPCSRWRPRTSFSSTCGATTSDGRAALASPC